jgi:TonB family protein
MRPLFLTVAVLFGTLWAMNAAQKDSRTPQNFDLKRCKPKMISKNAFNVSSLRVRKGEKPTGFSPTVKFEILESGEVSHVHLKRSSGIADMDKAALEWVLGRKYNARPGCGVIESEGSLNIDLTSVQ